MNALRHLPVALIALLVALSAAGMAQDNETFDEPEFTDEPDLGQEVNVDNDDDGGIAWIWVILIGAVLVIALIAIVAASNRHDHP